MKFYFDDGDCFDLLETILCKEKIPYKFEYEEDGNSGTICWGMGGIIVNNATVKRLTVNTDLEHYDFIKFLLKKELKKEKRKSKMLEKLEDCYKLTIKNNKKKNNKPNEEVDTTRTDSTAITITFNHI